MENITYDKKIFADNLNRLMALNGENQVDIARLLNVSKSTVSAYCKGTQMPRMDKVEILSQHFNVLKSELLEDSSAAAPEQTEEQQLLEYYRSREDMRMLFKLAKGATAEDIKTAAAIIEALRKKDE